MLIIRALWRNARDGPRRLDNGRLTVRERLGHSPLTPAYRRSAGLDSSIWPVEVERPVMVGLGAVLQKRNARCLFPTH
jgi:hypothetical protein